MLIPKALSHALYALCCLSDQPSDGVVRAADIARAVDAPPEYVRKILLLLRNAGFASSVRGRQGGYTLNVSLKDVSVADVWRCLGFKQQGDARRNRICALNQDEDCRVEAALQELQEQILTFLSNRSVASLIKRTGSAPCSLFRDRPLAESQSHHRQPFSVPPAPQTSAGETGKCSGT